jgi:hypothetical protein
MPPFLGTWVQDGHDEYAIPVMSLLMTLSPQLAWAVRNGMSLLRTATKYTLDGVADQILAPTLIMEASTTPSCRVNPSGSRKPSSQRQPPASP